MSRFADLKYVAEHGGELDLDSTRLAIAGDSVGGNMAAVHGRETCANWKT